ncbi:hypothetical protein ACHAXN_003558 [Cyclotella atomus]
MLALRSLTRSSATSTTRRHLVTSAQKRALNKQQLEGSEAKPPPPPHGGGDAIKPASVPPASDGSSSGGGGGALVALLLAGGAAGAAYYNDMIPREYLPDFLSASSSSAPAVKKEKVSDELKQAVEQAKAASKKEAKSDGADETRPPEPEPIEHPPDGNRVTNEKISTFYSKVNDGKNREEQLSKAQESAAKATQYNEGETILSPRAAVDTALPSSASALRELQSKSQSETQSAITATTLSLRSDLDQTFLSDLDSLSLPQLRTRFIQLVSELSDRTKWEALRIQEYTALKEKELSEKYMEILQKQRLEYEDILASRIREAEDTIMRQANEALRAKEEGVQLLLTKMREGRDKEVADIVLSEVDSIKGELELEYQTKLQNELASFKNDHLAELEAYQEKMKEMQLQLSTLETSLQILRQYEHGSKKAHAISAAALALATKLENGESMEVEVEALRGAIGSGEGGESSVIVSAVNMIPERVVESGGSVMSLGELQVAFDRSYKKGREAAMVPEGRSGLGGQLLGMLFAKLSVPPSPETSSSSEETDPAILSDSILSMARQYVQSGDLERAIQTLDKLKGQTAYVMNDWKKNAMDRVATERALKVIKLECALLNKDLVS